MGGIPRDSTSIIGYAFYDLTPKVKLGVRGEWFQADAVDYYTVTYGINWRPHPNLIIRPEIRQMFSENHQIYTGSGFSGQLLNNTVYSADVILTF